MKDIFIEIQQIQDELSYEEIYINNQIEEQKI